MNRELLALASDLHRRHQPYVVATVVWARGPSSGKQGGAALIEPDGTVHGWIGGACAEPAVLREARRVLRDGEARLMYLGPAEELDGHTRDGVMTVPIACASEGALEVFMEPVLPQPHVVVVGRSPAVKMLARLVLDLDWRVTVVEDGGDGEGHAPGVSIVTSVAAMSAPDVDDATAVVVATQGHYDEPALEAALATRAPYVGLVASAKRAENVLGYLRDRGFGDEELRRVHTPAGLDLGPIEHREIAVAVLAELVAIRASGGLSGAASVPEIAPVTSVDPVCGMSVDVEGARFVTVHGDETYRFCCPGCKSVFETQPAEYAR
ncbi:MAG: XdhC family protein [Acidimicrobiia bacterium]